LSVALQLAASRAWVTGALIALMLLLGALLYQRRRHVREQLAAQQALKQANEVLENKVQQRTADLQSANVALQQEVMERMQAETTLRAAQDELVQAGKLAVIGQLSTEVAHELNQPLAALRALAGNSQRFLERGQSEMVQSNLQRMAELTERMGRITGQLRNFARKSAGQPEPVELAKVVDGALSSWSRALPKAAS
jgi:two-component system C4-dicarboxylate transport sensor histidine kinase DctB